MIRRRLRVGMLFLLALASLATVAAGSGADSPAEIAEAAPTYRGRLAITGIEPSCAAPGGLLVLDGYGFRAHDLEVTFDDAPAEAVDRRTDRLVVRVPKDGTSGLATVTVRSAGRVAAIGLEVQGEEVCDGADNDCNGVVDDLTSGEICEQALPEQDRDFFVTSVEVSPSYPMPGENASVTVEVRSSGRSAHVAGSDTVSVTLYGNRDRIGLQQVELERGAAATLTFPWTPLLAGDYALRAVVDDDDLLDERHREDNTTTAKTVVAFQPDLSADFSIVDLKVISHPDRFYVPRVTVGNAGPRPAAAPLVIHGDGQPIALLLTGPVPAGGSATFDVPWPEASPLGLLTAEINPRFERFEANPSDNADELDLRDPVDLSVEHVSVQTLATEDPAGPSVTISFRVVNRGRDPIVTPFTTRLQVNMVDETFFDIPTESLTAGEAIYASQTIDGVSAFSFSINADVDELLGEANRVNNVVASDYAAGTRTAQTPVNRWRSIGPRSIFPGIGATGRLSVVAISPNFPQFIYVGSSSGSKGDPGGSGVWATFDGGATWRPIGDSLPSQSIWAMAAHPWNPLGLFVVTRDKGVFRTDTGGLCWTRVHDKGLNAFAHNGADFLIDPDEPDRLYLCATGGLQRSTNGGKDWTNVLPKGDVLGLVMDPANPRKLHAAVNNAPNPADLGIWATNDGGDNWRRVTGCPGDELPETIPKGTYVRLTRSGSTLIAGLRFGGPCEFTIYRTTDIGCTVGGVGQSYWEKRGIETARCGQLWSGLYADPVDPDTLYLTGIEFVVSRDGGISFDVEGGPQPHADHHDLTFDPSDPKVVYAASDGGLYKSTDRARPGTWSFISAGITNVEFFDIADDPSDSPVVIGGTQDNGNLKYDGTSQSWELIKGGDGFTVDIDPTNGERMIAMHQYSPTIVGSNDGGASFPRALGLPRPDWPHKDCGSIHFQFHPTLPSMLLASCSPSAGPRGLWRKIDDAPWNVIFTPPTGKIVRSVVDPTIDLYYAGASDGKVWAGPSGANWRVVFQHPAGNTVTDMELDPVDPTVLYVSFEGNGAGRIFRLQRSSPSPTEATTTSAAIASGLAQGRVRAIGIDVRNAETLYAATNRGVYRCRSVSAWQDWAWSDYNDGLPTQVDVSDLEIHPLKGVMRASTRGRSAFEVDTAPPLGSILAAEGRPTFLRIHDVGVGFGPADDGIDGEVIVQLDTHPGRSFGFRLRVDAEEPAHRRMVDVLRDAFAKDRRVRVEYQLADLGVNHEIFRVIRLD